MDRSRPLVGLIRNPLSHHSDNRAVESPEQSALLVRAPATHDELRSALAEFEARRIDYLAVEGGDGTVRDLLTWGHEIFGDEWPAIIILPSGKTNALAVDLGLPKRWLLRDAIIAARAGSCTQRRPMRLTGAEEAQKGKSALRNSPPECIQGFFLGAGAFKRGTQEGQAVHRLSLFGGLAVAVILVWSILQIILGRANNRWRRCTRLLFARDENGASFPHSDPEAAEERFLAVATTYRRFSFGARPFGRNPKRGIHFGIVDKPRRCVMLMLPLLAMGFHPPAMARAGVHRLTVEAAAMDIGDSFIVDGEAFPAGSYLISLGPPLRFVVPETD